MQTKGVEAAATEAYLPQLQEVQEVFIEAPRRLLYVPAIQDVQVVDKTPPGVLEYVPATQGQHKTALEQSTVTASMRAMLVE